ncbi:hypothetical protein AB0D46_37050 [Streptomyces sp. NPDC048383]|uniref:hypothetical protein n=1 Tax=Streptomyces sp. NPDC048383 TaxID=3155386 RepID=UPI003449AABA
MSLRPRRTAVALTLSALALTLLPAGARAAAFPVTPAPLASATPAKATPTTAQVDTFLTKYRSAVQGSGPEAPAEVREGYLTPAVNAALDQWAAAHDADPVFRAQNVPDSWTVSDGGSSPTAATVIVTQNWGDGTTSDVRYEVRLPDLRITDLTGPPA